MGWGFEFVEVSRRPQLRGLSFGAPAAAVTALTGPAGSGKTAAFRLACGLDAPDAGAVIVAGTDLARARPRTRARVQRRMAVVFEPGTDAAYALFGSATVAQNVAFCVRQAGRTARRRLEAETTRQLERFGLHEVADAQPPQLLPEQRKRLALARALALRSPLVLIDDLPADLEPGQVAALADLLRREVRERGGTCLVTITDLAVAERVADQVVHVAAPAVPALQEASRGVKFPPPEDAPAPAAPYGRTASHQEKEQRLHAVLREQ
ncbi:MAG TPA: ATP-binding cassette domain-containing protein [Baekduia sp.]|nr:ATP-binding cassette domain-containing protein [Baekduia sp.]